MERLVCWEIAHESWGAFHLTEWSLAWCLDFIKQISLMGESKVTTSGHHFSKKSAALSQACSQNLLLFWASCKGWVALGYMPLHMVTSLYNTGKADPREAGCVLGERTLWNLHPFVRYGLVCCLSYCNSGYSFKHTSKLLVVRDLVSHFILRAWYLLLKDWW